MEPIPTTKTNSREALVFKKAFKKDKGFCYTVFSSTKFHMFLALLSALYLTVIIISSEMED